MTALTLFDKFEVSTETDLPRSAAASLLEHGSTFKRISIKGGVFRLIVGSKEIATKDERYMDVVFVNAAEKIGRTYFPGTYEEGSGQPPVCWSVDGDTPSPDVKNPQHSSCKTCPQNVKGSGNTADARACRHQQRLAVVLENDIGGDVFGLQLPATSIWGDNTAKGYPLSSYSEQLKSRNIDPGHIVTRVSFDVNSATPKLVFAPQRRLTRDEAIQAVEQGMTESAKQAVTMVFKERDDAAGMGVVHQPSKHVDTQANADVVPQASPAEPAVRPTATPAAKNTAKVADLIKQFGTDD